ncbi:conserved Plasmodium protein, unknown function [Plasmodium berghei]|uniref:Uncharacterized protein n=2 Tax=Plasmodium berghei TaxID=5821 RepID=A0A509AK24_PLABA|nr:conserved Plasmodium protein, unknown function [Plasmodium berghei ANKA]CXI23626.1 conserved Plasmodium protein, unknown function [Plasmodium berghei]SCM20217.1 conserved Plasmodium protein, unknown function [Plasmodium berghei]SCO59266.1 conserved Plasmodium protein, unknown function [Plasmodium berghei]SCO60241.1 conserved Plasmodium protein, unknown function [Plasmodium berghei]VUC54985.1 conserved Plasmodium protein, unknown function [Plasmodium berghei ANKA]|eukprot:XP_034420804.1 conserved Plasmodium protein, unknown function [Plasmodium berghei ANKA]
MPFEYDIKKRKKKKKKKYIFEENSIDDELLGISELFKDNDDEINDNNNEEEESDNTETSEDNDEDIKYKESYVRNKNNWKGGEYNNSKDEHSKHDPNVEDQKKELKDEDEMKKNKNDTKYNLFISKSYIKTIGLLYNITNDKIMFENDACFEQISNIIELRIKQIIEEASKFYEKRKRFCVNKYLNINDLTNSCNYLNVKFPYKYKSSIYNPNFISLDKNSKNNKTLYRLINKQEYKHNNKKFTKKHKNTYLRKLKKKKKSSNLKLSADNIFKDWRNTDHNKAHFYKEFPDLKKEKSDNIDNINKEDFIKKKDLSDNDKSENERKELSYNFDENEDDREVSFPDGEGCAEVIANIEAGIGSDLDVELDAPQKENDSNNGDQDIDPSLKSYEIDINNIKIDNDDDDNNNNINNLSKIEQKESFENEEVEEQLGIGALKTEFQNNIELNKDKDMNFDLFEIQKMSEENKIVDSDDEINIEENNLLHAWYVKKNENNKKNVLNVLFSDMQNVLPLEENLTVFWLFIQNQYKKKKKKDKMKKNDEEIDETLESKHNKLIHFDYQCYEILYTIEKREDNLYHKSAKTDKERLYNNYMKFKDIGNSYTNFDQEKCDNSSHSNEGNIFLLPKLRPINKEYTILLKYILEIIKDIINYKTNFFDYNNILHIFSTSKEINKILPNILFFLFNELDHNLRFNNIYSGLMLLILLNGIIKNRNIDIDFYCLQILKMLIHVIIYEHDLKLKNIYLILLFKRKACDIIIDFCSLLRIKNNNEIINIDYYLAYILSKLLTHNKCTYMHIYASYYLIYLMPINIHIKFFLSYTPNFLSIFFRKYLYYQNVYNILLSYEQKEISELFNFFFFHIYTLIQGSLYKIFKHLGILVFNSSSSIYLNYLMNFIAEYADYHLPLILSITNVLGVDIEEDGSTTNYSESEWDSSIDSDWGDRKGMSFHNTNEVNNLLFKKMNKIKNKINIKSKIKKKNDKIWEKKKKYIFDISTIKMYELKKNSNYLSKNINYLKNINKLYNLYLQSEKNNDDYSIDDYGNDENLSLNINMKEKKAYLSSYIKKRMILNKDLIQRASEEKELQTNIVVNQVLSIILYNLNAKERHKTKSHMRSSNANLYDSYYYFLYTL